MPLPASQCKKNNNKFSSLRCTVWLFGVIVAELIINNKARGRTNEGPAMFFLDQVGLMRHNTAASSPISINTSCGSHASRVEKIGDTQLQ